MFKRGEKKGVKELEREGGREGRKDEGQPIRINSVQDNAAKQGYVLKGVNRTII